MPRAAKFSLKNVEDAVSRFNAEDYKAHIMPVFPEFQWAEIRDYAIKEKLPLSKRNVAKIMAKMFGQSNPGENEIKMRICSLKLIEVSTYPTRRLWTAFELQGSKGSSEVDTDPDQLEKALGQALRHAEVRAMRQITVHDGFYWVMVVPTKKSTLSREMQIQGPSFFAYMPGCPYLFSTKKSRGRHSEILEALKMAFGYEKMKHLSLEGPDLKALLQMLKYRNDKCVDTEQHPMQLDSPELLQPDISVESGNVTLSERSARIEYADKVFGTNPPALKSLTFHAKNLQPPHKVWGDEPIDVQITFSGKNVFNTIKRMTELGVVKTPYPPFMHQALLKGKNIMVLQQTGAQQDNEA